MLRLCVGPYWLNCCTVCQGQPPRVSLLGIKHIVNLKLLNDYKSVHAKLFHFYQKQRETSLGYFVSSVKLVEARDHL